METVHSRRAKAQSGIRTLPSSLRLWLQTRILNTVVIFFRWYGRSQPKLGVVIQIVMVLIITYVTMDQRKCFFFIHTILKTCRTADFQIYKRQTLLCKIYFIANKTSLLTAKN